MLVPITSQGPVRALGRGWGVCECPWPEQGSCTPIAPTHPLVLWPPAQASAQMDTELRSQQTRAFKQYCCKAYHAGKFNRNVLNSDVPFTQKSHYVWFLTNSVCKTSCLARQVRGNSSSKKGTLEIRPKRNEEAMG